MEVENRKIDFDQRTDSRMMTGEGRLKEKQVVGVEEPGSARIFKKVNNVAVQVARLVSGVEVERNPEPAPVYFMCLWDEPLRVGGSTNVASASTI